jgi:hypothetical protein
MRLLSLDFDGPLHPVSAIADKITSVSGMELDRMVQDRDLFRWMAVLECALEGHDDVLIAVHSNWRRYASNSQLRGYLGNLADRFVGITSLELPRCEGIEELARRAEVDHLLVIDDDLAQFPTDYAPLLAVDPEMGLSSDTVLQALDTWLRATAPVEAAVARP